MISFLKFGEDIKRQVNDFVHYKGSYIIKQYRLGAVKETPLKKRLRQFVWIMKCRKYFDSCLEMSEINFKKLNKLLFTPIKLENRNLDKHILTERKSKESIILIS